jgi:hypothetical protein
MSDTPETDAAADWYLGASCSTDPDDRTVPLAVSRKLERERDEAQAALEGAKIIARIIAAEMLVNVKDIEKERDKAREDATNYYARIGELESERDEARREIEGWQNKWDCAITVGAMAEIERDDARKLSSSLHEDQVNLIMEGDKWRECSAKLCDLAERMLKEMEYVDWLSTAAVFRDELNQIKKKTNE